MATPDTRSLLAELAAAGFAVKDPPRIRDFDIPRIGYKIGCGEDEIHAVLDVEAPRGGYDSSGRLAMLYEPHVAYRCAPSDAVRKKLVAAGLAYKSYGAQPYPKESYSRFKAAFAIDPTTAIKACSWGRAQILGENFASAGYASPQEMLVRLAYGGEVEHLEAMVSFIRNNHLDDELRDHRWAAFARGYNGPKYKTNAYDTKLAARFAWWAARPDTPWTPDYVLDVRPGPAPVVEVETPAPAPAVQPVVDVAPPPADTVAGTAPETAAPAPPVADPAPPPAIPGTPPASITPQAEPVVKKSFLGRLVAGVRSFLFLD